MSHIRLGFSESTLLAYYVLDLFKNDNLGLFELEYDKFQNNKLNCLYSTSGFYDKQITGSYMNYNYKQILESPVYKAYFDKLLNIIKNTKYSFILSLSDDITNKQREFFLKYINYTYRNPIDILRFIDNKDVLIINSLASLMKHQFESGNIKKINSNFPDNVKSIQCIDTESTIINDGTDTNILETVDKICTEISNYTFDCCIISVGAYSLLIADFIINNLKKEIYVIGGDLPLYFGISTKRIKNFHKDLINEYFINVPDEYKPINYELVEDGCYW